MFCCHAAKDLYLLQASAQAAFSRQPQVLCQLCSIQALQPTPLTPGAPDRPDHRPCLLSLQDLLNLAI